MASEEDKILKEIEKRMKKEKGGTNAINFVKDNLSKIMVVVIASIYVLYGAFVLEKTDSTIEEIIGNISVALIIGTSISFCMRRAGSQDAMKSDYYNAIREEHARAKEEIINDIDKLPNFCNMKNKIDIEAYKKSLIETINLNYKAWKLGFYDKEENKSKLSIKQKLILSKINDVSIKKINSMDILNEANGSSTKELERFGRFGKSEKEYSRNKTFTGVLGMLIFSIVFGYYTMRPVFEEETIATIVWNLFQVIIWVGNGCLKYYDNKNFILYEYSEKNIKTKTNLLKEFKAVLRNNPAILDKYSDNVDDDIDKFIKEKEGTENGSRELQKD